MTDESTAHAYFTVQGNVSVKVPYAGGVERETGSGFGALWLEAEAQCSYVELRGPTAQNDYVAIAYGPETHPDAYPGRTLIDAANGKSPEAALKNLVYLLNKKGKPALDEVP